MTLEAADLKWRLFAAIVEAEYCDLQGCDSKDDGDPFFETDRPHAGPELIVCLTALGRVSNRIAKLDYPHDVSHCSLGVGSVCKEVLQFSEVVERFG